jgi:hypothetical protein
MATNINGHLVDDKGNVVVDFVWGNFPLQPNDDRNVTPTNSGNTYPSGLLNYALDNHVIAETGWNGYPLYTPNDKGEAQGTAYTYTAYVALANYLGLTIANATTAIAEAECVISNTANATNTAKAITSIARTSGNKEVTITASGAFAAYLTGSKITIGASTGIPTELVGDWTVTGGTTPDTIKFTSNGTSALSVASGALTGSASLTGKSGTIKTQSPVAGADNVAIGATVTTTSWA